MNRHVNRSGEDALVTTIANLGAIAGKCDPNRVLVDYSIESRSEPAAGFSGVTVAAPVPGSSRIEVDAGSVFVLVKCDRAVPYQEMYRYAIHALCRIVAKRTPKAVEVSIETGKRKTARTRYTFRM